MAGNVPKLSIRGDGGDGKGGKGLTESRTSRVSRASTSGCKTDSSRRRKGMGLFEPLSYEDQQRKRIQVEKVTKVFSTFLLLHLQSAHFCFSTNAVQ